MKDLTTGSVPLLRPDTKIWGGMLRIGVPAGAEFLLLFVYIMLVYAIIRGFGPAAQAGFGIGARVMQALFLPVVALSFAVSPVVGQNFGRRRADRLRRSVYSAIGIGSLMMLVLTLIAYFAPATLIRVFSRDPRVIAFGGEYLQIVSLNFISAGIVAATDSAEGFDRNRHSPKRKNGQTTMPIVTASAPRCRGFPMPLNRAAIVPANRNTMKLIPQRPMIEAIWITGRQFICV